jgi:hypothetical protein
MPGLAKPGKTRGLMGTGTGLAQQETAGQVFGRCGNRTAPFIWSKPGPLPGCPDPLQSVPTAMIPRAEEAFNAATMNTEGLGLRSCSLGIERAQVIEHLEVW